MRQSRRVPRLLFAGWVLAGVPLGLLGIELLARQRFPSPRHYAILLPRYERTFEPQPEIMPGVAGPSLYRTNSLGLRGDELAADAQPRVVAVGGSATECLYLDQSEAWPQLVQEHLRKGFPSVWVANGGRSGHTTREHVLQVEHLIGLEPRPQLLLVMAGVNDLCKRLAQDADYDPRAMERPERRRELTLSAFSVLPDGPDSNLPWFKQTAVWRLASHLRARSTRDPRVQQTTGEIYLDWRRRRREASALRTELPELGPALAEFRDNLTTIVREAREAGVAVALLEQPALWREDLPQELEALLWMGGVGEYTTNDGCEYYTSAALARGLVLYNKSVAEVGAAEGVQVVELSREFSGQERFFYDDVHLTEEGARAVAERVAGQIAARPPFAPAESGKGPNE
jgi:lysophospholipase L1-like esterase